MVWAAVASAAATVVVGAISADASRSAANKQADAAKQAAQTAADSQTNALKFVQQQEQPYQQAGQQALGQYQSLLNGGAANFDISKLPGYQFQMQQGTDAIQNSAAARGGALSGNAMQGLQSYGQGLASTQFQNYMSQLAGLSNMGQAAASMVANQGSNLMSGAGASLAGGIMGAGNAQAAGTMGANNAWQGVFNSPTVQKGLGAGFGQLFNSPAIGGGQAPNNAPGVTNLDIMQN